MDPEWSWKESLGPLPHAAHRAPHLGSPLHFLAWMKRWKKKNEEKEDKKEERKMNQKKKRSSMAVPCLSRYLFKE